jgi:hypothetical protein
MDHIRSIWSILVSVLQEIFNFGNQKTTSVVEFYEPVSIVDRGWALEVIESVSGSYLGLASMLKHLRPQFVVDDELETCSMIIFGSENIWTSESRQPST